MVRRRGRRRRHDHRRPARQQAVDTLIYAAGDHSRRYSAAATVVGQHNLFTHHRQRAALGRREPAHDDRRRRGRNHDTVGGACSQESNTLRYGHHTKHQHACVENFLVEGARWGLGKRDLVSNINFFMNVPVDPDGALGIVDGLSAPGKRLALRADVDALVLVSNCPQISTTRATASIPLPSA
ncbi:DUF1989 domain-containing protein [Rhodococcus hoagii]|nr:DUF1989 domain-containing protein [Prescottella equi]NKZ88092.1 DUF1989 domain-containing protein [Prescottella equi]